MARRKRRLTITRAKAAELLAKKEELHPVAVAIAEAVATQEIEEVHIYAAAEPPEPEAEPLIPVENINVTTPKPKTWWQNLWS